jgi:uncharacterized caspase-like protein
MSQRSNIAYATKKLLAVCTLFGWAKIMRNQFSILLAQVLIVVAMSSGASSSQAQEKRFALLVGNQAYDASVGILKNPHNDIAIVETSLKKQSFEILPIVKDARRSAILGAVRDLANRLRTAGPGAVGFLYYSGHGAAEKDTGINYIIPVDAKDPGSTQFWDESIKLDEIMRLLDQARGAVKFVVFDACRNELQLPSRDTTKGLVPVAEQQGFFVAYASAPGRTATDRGEKSGPYAAALSAEIGKRGLDHLNLFQNVKEAVIASTGGSQHPWESNGLTRRIYLGGEPTTAADMALWERVRMSSDPLTLQGYIDRFPQGLFANTAAQMIERLKAEALERDKTAAERNALEAKQVEELRKALDEASSARKAIAAVEQRRLAAEQLATDLHKAQQMIQSAPVGTGDLAATAALAQRAEAAADEARKMREALAVAHAKQKEAETRLAALKMDDGERRSADRSGPTVNQKIAALPRILEPKSGAPFDGAWVINISSPRCMNKTGQLPVLIDDSVLTVKSSVGTRTARVSPSGSVRWSQPAMADGASVIFEGTLKGSSGSGIMRRADGKCDGTFTAKRLQ